MSELPQRVIELMSGILVPEMDFPIVECEMEGGGLTLLFSGNLFALSLEDRAFVFGLVDAIKAHRISREAQTEKQQGEPAAPVEPIPDPEPDSFAGAEVTDAPDAEGDTDPEAPTAGENPAPVATFAVEVPTRKPLDLALRECHECGESFKGAMGLAAHRRNRHPNIHQLPERIATGLQEVAILEEADAPQAHVHRWTLTAPDGPVVHQNCACGASKDVPSDPLIGSDNWPRKDRPSCPDCGKRPAGDKFGYWCNGCQKAVVA